MSTVSPIAPDDIGKQYVPVYNEFEPLSDLVAYSDFREDKPELTLETVAWLSDLALEIPRENIHCLSRTTLASKRLLDVILASIFLVVLSPVMLLTALAVKFTSPGGAIFSQRRVGLNLRKDKSDRRQRITELPDGISERRSHGNDRRTDQKYGQEFTLYKFRTMRNDAEKNGAQFAVAGDPRVTSIGRFLRKTRLDELPQLWNVLRGEMSMVGPRPERPEFIKELSEEIPNYVQRLGLKPGLTGVAQIENGYDNNIESFRRKVTYDLIYLQNCCVWNDLKILWKTIRVVLTGSGAL